MSELFETPPPRPAPIKGCAWSCRVPLPERGLATGDLYPYAEYGQTELDAMNLYRAGILEVRTSPTPTALPAVPVQPGLVPAAGLEPAGEAIVEMGAVIAPGGEKRPTVATPEQQRTKHKRR